MKRARLEAAAEVMTLISRDGCQYAVEETYLDCGAGIKWETIICHYVYWNDKTQKFDDDSYQAIYPADKKRIVECESTLELFETAIDIYKYHTEKYPSIHH